MVVTSRNSAYLVFVPFDDILGYTRVLVQLLSSLFTVIPVSGDYVSLDLSVVLISCTCTSYASSLERYITLYLRSLYLRGYCGM